MECTLSDINAKRPQVVWLVACLGWWNRGAHLQCSLKPSWRTGSSGKRYLVEGLLHDFAIDRGRSPNVLFLSTESLGLFLDQYAGWWNLAQHVLFLLFVTRHLAPRHALHWNWTNLISSCTHPLQCTWLALAILLSTLPLFCREYACFPCFYRTGRDLKILGYCYCFRLLFSLPGLRTLQEHTCTWAYQDSVFHSIKNIKANNKAWDADFL